MCIVTTVLLTGFEPFDGAAGNSSWDAAALVARGWTGPATLITASLPVVFGRAADELEELIERHSPDLVVATGLAEGRTGVTPERVAINLDDARIPDNAGARPVDEPIVPDGPAAYFSGLPVKAIVERIRAAGVPASVSDSAGTFVCNHVMYRLMHSVVNQHPYLMAGFVHVPAAETLDLKMIALGMEIAVLTSLDELAF